MERKFRGVISLILAILCPLVAANGQLMERNMNGYNFSKLVDYFSVQCAIKTHEHLNLNLNYDIPETPVKVRMEHEISQISEVDDLKQTMTVVGSVRLTWRITCPQARLDAVESMIPEGFGGLDRVEIPKNAKDVWVPLIRLRNAVKDVYPIQTQANEVYYSFERPYNLATTEVDTRLRLLCDSFSFAKFPFDTLSCDIEFELVDDWENLIFEQVFYTQDAKSKMVNEAALWKHVGPLTFTVRNETRFGNTHGVALFNVKVKRKAEYYVGGIFVPLGGLIVLQLTGLILPPSWGDRPAFCVTVVLAFYVTLQVITASIPRTSEKVYLIEFIVIQMAMSIVITGYTLIACTMTQQAWTEKLVFKTRFFNLSRIRLIDICIATIATAVIILSGAVFFGKMIS